MTISQLKVQRGLDAGKVGALYDLSDLVEEDDLPHAGTAADEVTHVVVDTAANNTKYSFTVQGEEVSFTSDANATIEEIAQGLRDDANANPVVRGMVEATTIDNDATAGEETVVLTALYQNIDLDVSTTDANLTVSEATAAGDWEDIPFGRAIYIDADGNATLSNPNASDLNKLVGISRFTFDEEGDLDKPAKSYAADSKRPVVFVRTGRVRVESSESPSRGDEVWVGQDSDEEGQFFTADNAGTTRVKASTDVMTWYKPGVIEIKKGL